MPRRTARTPAKDTLQPRSVRGPYRQGDDTRQALVAAALSLFGTRGFEATTTREIAAAAGVAVPAITYHFDGKEGLHLACADDVVARYRAHMLAPLEALQARAAKLTPEEARAALRQIAALLMQMLVAAAADGAPWLTFMIREMGRSGTTHDRLYEGLWAPGLTLIASLIARVRGRDAANDADRLDALLLLSTPSVFGYAQPVTARFGNWLGDPGSLGTALTEQLSSRIDAL